MTYAEIEARIISDLNRTDLNASIPGYVNDVYREIIAMQGWSWLTATTEASTEVGEWRYEVPTDYGDVRSFVVVDGTESMEIPYITVEEFDKRYPAVATDTASLPEIFTVRHGITPAGDMYNEFNVYPKADSASYVMRVWYAIGVPDLSGNIVPVIPLSYQQVLIFGGLETAFARLREYEAAGYWANRKRTTILAMIESDKKFPSNPVLRPFGATQTLPPEYWRKYTVRSI